MKKFLIAGAAVAAFAVTPALAQQVVAPGYAPQGYMMAAPYAAVSGPYGFIAPGVDGAFNPGVSDQERSLYTQLAPTIGWPGGPRGW